jgi:hypothetical protein
MASMGATAGVCEKRQAPHALVPVAACTQALHALASVPAQAVTKALMSEAAHTP